jgi:hypothetical protein
MPYTTPKTLTRNSASRSSGEVSSRSLTWAIPALLMKTSTLPSSLATRSTSPKTASRSETSAAIATDRRPRALTSSATFSAPSALTSLMATSAPSAASRSAMALPIPLAAPVTTATFLSMLLMGTYLLVGASSGW